ncbi:MAG: DUF3071 domain-containing protein [Microbacteriaceae bacterium]|nr:DUF3071 domain-containing protein [Microbacteriaceae bacterium]
MHELTVTGVENGALVVSTAQGSQFHLAINEALHSALRAAAQPASVVVRKLAPREIQAHIRAGMSAQDVAAITGAPLTHIQKFEGPILAEREFVVQSALNVAVHTARESESLVSGSTFGSVIRERLSDLGATGERWASWKEVEGGWVVKLAFTAANIDHDARWRYDPKSAALAPINGEANTLSQQGEMPGGLIPRLRAVGGDERVPDSSRFDSGAFDLDHEFPERQGSDRGNATRGPATQALSQAFGRNVESSPEVSAAAINRAPVENVANNQTTDLLEALRRRRGERESAAVWDDVSAPNAPSGLRVLDPARNAAEPELDRASTAPQPAVTPKPAARKGRAAMPSWDDIVFGARSEDDPA